jgi:predicted MFS family arabinose efflux permease
MAIILVILFIPMKKMNIPCNNGSKISFIVCEGFNTPPFRAIKKVLNPETNTLPKQHTPPFRARLLINAHKKVYSNWRTFFPGLLFFFHTFMYIALFTFLPGLSGNEHTKNMLLVTLPLISIIGTMIAGIVSQYFVSPSRLSIIAYISLLILIFVIKLSFNNNILFAAASMVLILFSGIIQGSVFSLIPNISLTTEEQTSANGAVAQLGNLGSTLGQPVFSYFLVYGKNSIIIIVMLLAILGTITSCYLPPMSVTRDRRRFNGRR